MILTDVVKISKKKLKYKDPLRDLSSARGLSIETCSGRAVWPNSLQIEQCKVWQYEGGTSLSFVEKLSFIRTKC